MKAMKRTDRSAVTSRLLFCLPYAGGSARSLSNVTYRLGGNIRVKGLELAGRGSRHEEPLCTNLEAIIDDLYGQIEAAIEHPAQRIFIWGHSMGAILALLLACRLKERGACNFGGLIVSAMTGPAGYNRSERKLHQLPHEDFLQYFSKLVPAGKGTVEKHRNNQLLERMLFILRADIRALENFSPEDWTALVIDAPIHVLIGEQDEIMPNRHDYHSWANHTRDTARQYLVNGGHFFVLEQSLQTADILRNIINN